MADDARSEKIAWVYSSKSNQELEERYNQWAADYDKDVVQDLGFLGPKTAAETLARRVSGDAKVLDAGAGTGAVGVELSKLGFKHITAIDLSPGMLDVARSKGVYEALQKEELGTPLHLDTDAFDATICVGTLTIGHAPVNSLDEFVRVTKPGGFVVFSMRPDHYERGGFKAKQDELEAQGKWKLLERGEQFQPFPIGEPEMWYEIWTYEVLP